ncbi:MAG: arginine--tRNA ligase [Phycisphaerales bacterium]|nr:arginine--tRNA ligase [Phycisphaerales bacterium]
MASVDPANLLRQRVRDAIVAAFGDAAGDADALIAPSRNPQFGDFQCNAAMPLAKKLGKPPRDIAGSIVEHLDITDLTDEPTIAGPGFINFTLKTMCLTKLLCRLDTSDLGIEKTDAPRRVVMDLSSVNVAKQMHVGHIRSTVIGDSLSNVLERLGHTVIRQNHLGDWGVPICMTLSALHDANVDLDSLDMEMLSDAYRRATSDGKPDYKGLQAVHDFELGPKTEAELQAQVDGAEQVIAKAKSALLKLQTGDAQTVRDWRKLIDVTMVECGRIYERLHVNITREHDAGESTYRDKLAPLVDRLLDAGLAQVSQGAVIIWIDDVEEPFILRKSDGGFLYATTDLAAIEYRVGELACDQLIYVVDARQRLHFRLLFAAARKVGIIGDAVETVHVPFGSILGPDGTPLKTRSGENIRLTDLLDEAVSRAADVVARKNPDLSDDERRQVAEAVGIGAIKYADLAQDVAKDYVFTFDRMLAFEGDTGPYLLNAYVRIQSIFRKADVTSADFTDAELLLDQPQERALALAMLQYPSAVESTAAKLQPHHLCQFAYSLATAFASFYEHCPVLRAETDDIKRSRLRLCDLTSRLLADALGLLGIRTIDRM